MTTTPNIITTDFMRAFVARLQEWASSEERSADHEGAMERAARFAKAEAMRQVADCLEEMLDEAKGAQE